jgi:hypothetical protein
MQDSQAAFLPGAMAVRHKRRVPHILPDLGRCGSFLDIDLFEKNRGMPQTCSLAWVFFKGVCFAMTTPRHRRYHGDWQDKDWAL